MKKITNLFVGAITAAGAAAADIKIDLQRIGTDFKGDFCYTHARGAVTPDGFAIITTQPLLLSGCDVFYGMEMLTSSDKGKNWSDIYKSKTVVRQKLPNGWTQAFCDATPMYHKKTGKILLIGHDAMYDADNKLPNPQPRHTLWSIYDPDKKDWQPFNTIKMPDEGRFYSCGNGSGQSYELENGDILIPVYFRDYEASKDPWHTPFHVAVMRCSFDGRELKLIECGNSISVSVPRGLGEPSIIKFKDKFFVALRNDAKGYVTSSKDGLTLEEPKVLVFDDGQESGNYCTQQHWFTLKGKLYMVYTRKGADNDHVFRHRAPLFMAEFDTEKMCLVRSSERVVVPERGARLGNFGCVSISENEAWVIASEWMQTVGPKQGNWKNCMKYGSDNSIFIAKITAK